MKELGVAEAASKVATKKRKSNVGAESKAKKAAPAEPTRRSSRARGEVSYKEPTMKDFEDIAAMEEDPGVRANAAANVTNRALGSHGMSRIVAPTGHVMVEATCSEETLLTHKLDLQLSTRSFACESLRSNYFLRDWYHSGISNIVDASMPPESPVIGPGNMMSPRSSSPLHRSAFASSSSSSVGRRRLGSNGGGGGGGGGGGVSTRRIRSIGRTSAGTSPAPSPSLSMYKRRRVESLPTYLVKMPPVAFLASASAAFN